MPQGPRSCRFLAALLCFIVCIAASGCQGGRSSKTPEGSGSDFKVALLTSGPVSDSSWNASAYEGLQAIQTELGAIVHQSVAQGGQIRGAMRGYAKEGYDLVLCHGSDYLEPAKEMLAEFPETVFVSASQGGGTIRFYLEQGFYLCGYMAGLMTKNNKAAMIGGNSTLTTRSNFKAFKAGALAANPKMSLIEAFTGSAADVVAAKQATLRAIGQGADLVIHQADDAAQGVFDACKEKGVYAFGTVQDQNANESGIVIASAYIDVKPAFLNIAREVKEGKYKGGVTLVGMKEGAVQFIFNPKFLKIIPDDIQGLVAGKNDEVRNGKVVAPKDEL